jgi:cell surface protein SprA
VNVSRRDPNFRQLNETPSFLTTSGVSVGTTLHLDRMLPARLGISMPFTVDYASSGVQQLFINRSDVRAEGIDGLRNPRDRRVNYSLSLRRAAPLEKGWYAPLVNGLALNGIWSTSGSQSAFQELSTSNYALSGGLNLSGESRDSRLPGFVDALFRLLPRRLRESGGRPPPSVWAARWRATRILPRRSRSRRRHSRTRVRSPTG